MLAVHNDILSELPFLEKVAQIVSRHGKAELQYTTAAFAPFSNAHRPDFVFFTTGFDGKPEAFFIEFRHFARAEQLESLLKAIPEPRDFVAENSEIPVFHAVGTSARLTKQAGNWLHENDIHVFDEVLTPEALASHIFNWVQGNKKQ